MPELAPALTRKARPMPAAAPVPEVSHHEKFGQPGGMPLFLQRREMAGAPPSQPGALIEEEDELEAIQTKLVVNAPGDSFEQEADAVAQLATSPKSTRITQSSPVPSEDEPLMQRKPVNAAPVRSSPHNGGAVQPPDSGSPLSDTVRGRVEPVLGADLASMRVHTSPAARQTAGALQARAFTNRDHIWLGPGESQSDESLIAHELTHVVQQSAGGAPPIQRKPSDYRHPEDGSAPSDRMQREIDEELEDEDTPEEMPEIDRGDVSARKETLQPQARPDVDRPAETRPNVEAAAAETEQTVDAPAEADGKGGEKKEDAKGESKDSAAIDAGAAAAQAAFGAASAETPPTVPPPVAAIEMVAPIDAGGRGLEPVPEADAAVAEIAEATQSMRDEGTGLQEVASAERSNARILHGNVHLISQGIAQSDLGVTASQTHATFRRSVVEQGRAALQVSREKTAMVAAEAPKYGEKADEGREDSEGMTEEAGALSEEGQANPPDDEEAAARANEQGGEINRAGADVGNLDRAFSGSQERSQGLAADAVQAAELNTQVEAKITQSSEMLGRTDDRLGQMRQQTNDARAQMDALSERPAQMLMQANETEAEGRRVVEASLAVEERLRTEQQTHRRNAAAIPAESQAEIALREQEGGTAEEFSTEPLPPAEPQPALPEIISPPEGGGGGAAGSGDEPPESAAAVGNEQQPPPPAGDGGDEEEPIPAVPPGGDTGAGGGETVVQRQPQAGYEDRSNIDLASPIASHIPQILGGAAPGEGEQPSTRAEQEAREQDRRRQEIVDIQAMAGKPFEETTAWERRRIALSLMRRHLWSGLSGIKWPGWGALAVGLINPITPLLGVVSGFSMVASGTANLFNVEAWRRDWVGNLLKTAADIATGLTIILGSITALAAVIAALCTALIIFSWGFLLPVLGGVVAFCASVMVTVGGWTIAVGKWALLLQFLCFLKNLYEAGVARNAAELQRTSDRMSSDVSAAGNVVLQMGMAKLAQVGGRGMQSSIARAGGGARWAGGLRTRLGESLRGAGRSIGRGGYFARASAALKAAPPIRGLARQGIAGGARSLWRGVTSMPSQLLAGARALPGVIRSPITSLRRAFGPGISRGFLIGEGVPSVPGWDAFRAAAQQGRMAAQLEPSILALRTETGAVDAAARARLLAQIPTVPATSVAEIEALAARTLGVPRQQITARLVGGGGGQEGASGAQVYRITFTPAGGEPTTISFVKVFPNTAPQAAEFASELSAAQRLNQQVLPNQGAARPLATGQTAAGEGVLVMTAAPGASIDDFLVQLGALKRAQAGLAGAELATNLAAQQRTLRALLQASRRNGEALGKLHATTRTTSQASAATFGGHARQAENILGQLPDLVAAHPELASVDFGIARQRLQQLITGIERNPGAASVVHGDFHPGNVFYDATTGRITFIDNARVHQSVNQAGTGIASPARDVASGNATINLFGSQYGLGATEIAQAQAAFMEGYASSVAANAFTPEALAFYRARFTLGQYIEALKTSSPRLTAADLMFREVFGL